MFKDKELRERLARVVEELRDDLRSHHHRMHCYIPSRFDPSTLTASEVELLQERLDATEIMARFQELYNFLGVDRKHTHAKTELVKVKK